MRNYLTELNIYGIVLLSRSRETVRYVLDNLLKHCNKVLVVLDNWDKETEDIVNLYSKKYKQIIIIKSTYEGTTREQEEINSSCIFNRFKNLQGKIRQIPLNELKKISDTGEKIDLLLWPDHDEVFTDNLSNLLNAFWNSKFRSVNLKAVDVFGDFFTIHREGMTSHSRIFKYATDLMADPHRWCCHLVPIKREERMGDRYTLVHLSLLTKESIDWKTKYWSCSKNAMSKWPLWRVGKDIRECSPKEIEDILYRPSDCTVEGYLNGGDKRLPMGIENAKKTLFEASTLLDELGVRHYLAFGTCLLIVRDGEISASDWDIDLISLGEDNEKLEKGKDKILSAGFMNFKRKEDIPKWKKADGTMSKDNYVRTYSFEKNGCRVDIDPMYESIEQDNLIILKGRKRELFASEVKKDWISKAKEIEYAGKKYKIPNPVEDYLKSNYGDTWVTPIYGPMDWDKRPCKRNIW